MKNTIGGFAVLLALLIPESVTFASGGTLFLSPAFDTHTVGQKFDMQVFVDTGGSDASAAEGEIVFDPTALAVDHISTEGSVVGTWATQPSFSNAAGTMQFTGWMSQKYAGSKGLLLTVTFTALRTTATSIRFVSGTILGAGSGDSNIITSMQSANVSIQPEAVIPVIPSPASVAPSVSPPPAAPMLMTPESESAAGSNLSIAGTADANSIVYIWSQENESAPTATTLSAGPDGSFTYVARLPAIQGVFSLWAQTEGKDGQKSALSKKVTISVKSNEVAAAVLSGIDVSSLSSYIALAFVTVLCAGFFYNRHRDRQHKRITS